MPISGTSDVAESAKGDTTTIRNGSSVVGVRPHGSYSVDSSRTAGGPSATQMQTKFISSFDDPKYYGSRSSLLTNLIAWYKFNEVAGAVRRNSISDSLSLTDNNTVARATGLINYGALLVDSNNEYLSISSGSANSMGDENVSMSIWIKFTSTSSNQVITEMWDSGQRKFQLMYYAADNNLRLYTSSNGTSSNYITSGLTTVSSGTWYNIVFTLSSSERRLYLNNSDVSTGTTSVTIKSSSTSSFSIGGVGELDAIVAEAGYWNKNVSTSELSSIYNSGAGITYPGF